MRAATSLLLLGVAPFALSACKKSQHPQDQNIAIDQPVTNETLANADVEMLPPDESSATPTDQLENGTLETNEATNEVAANSL